MGEINLRRLFRQHLATAVSVVVVVVLLTIRLGHIGDSEDLNLARFFVVEIVDGDTFRIGSGDRVRLANIDTPEKGDPYYDEATELLRSLIMNKEISLQFEDRRRDKYHRLLGNCFIDSMFVEEKIIEAGLGFVYLFGDNDLERPLVARLLSAQQKAIDARIGIWSIPHKPESVYLAFPGRYRLHRPYCEAVRNAPPGSTIKFESRLDAFRQGLSPCRLCRP